MIAYLHIAWLLSSMIAVRMNANIILEKKVDIDIV